MPEKSSTSSPSKSRKAAPGTWDVIQTLHGMIAESRDLPDILGYALDRTIESLGMKGGFLQVAELHGPLHSLSISRGISEKTASLLDHRHWEWIIANLDPAHAAPAMMELTDTTSMMEGLRADGLSACLLFPIRAGDRLIGILGLGARKSKALSAARRDFMATLATTLSVALVSAGLREQAGKLSEDLIILQEINKIISQHIDLEDVIQKIVLEGQRLVKTEHCHLFLLDDRSRRLVGSASTQSKGFNIREVEIDPSQDSIAITAVKERRAIGVESLAGDEYFRLHLQTKTLWRSAILAPLIAKEDVVGILVCSENQRERGFSKEEILRAETLAHQAAIAMENARLFQVVSRSQKEWETTFDAMQDCVSVHDKSGKLVRANRALARRLQTVPQQLIGRTCAGIYTRDALMFDDCRHMQALQSEGLIVEEVELPHMGGTFQVSVSPWYDKNNRVVGSIHVAKDISNEKFLQQQLIQSEKLSAIGELISGIAHELNNPLTGVMGYSQLLQLRRDLDEPAKESLGKINNLALRCQKIVQNLLSFARKQKPERKLSNINDILERTLELRNYELSVNNIAIARELDRNLPSTIADGHQLQQVFLNIITNAEQAMLEAHGRGLLTVRSRADSPAGRITVEIQDDGPGIPDKIITRIFDPFFTTKEVGKGTGLGLSLAYGIVQEHDGKIYAKSKPGEGATFVIELPVITQFQLDSDLLSVPTLEDQKFDRLIQDKRVLVVDDEKYILDFFVEVFRTFPMQVETAGDGSEATERLLAADFDLIVTDFKMPQMSGRDLYHWIRQHRPELTNRIIFVTGDTVSGETRSFFEETSSRYIAKPFKIEEIKETIQQTLESAV